MKYRTKRHSSGSALFANLKAKSNLRERNIIVLEIINCDPSIYGMDHSDLTVSNFMGYFIDTLYTKG